MIFFFTILQFHLDQTYDTLCHTNVIDSSVNVNVFNNVSGVFRKLQKEYIPQIGDEHIECSIIFGENYNYTQSIKIGDILYDPILVNYTKMDDFYIITYCANPMPTHIRMQQDQT